MSAPLTAQVWLSDPVTVSLVALAGTLLTALGAIVVAWINRQSNKRIEHQLTVNGGNNNPKTVPDRFQEVLEVIDQLREQVADLKADLREVKADGRETRDRVGDLENRRRPWPL